MRHPAQGVGDRKPTYEGWETWQPRTGETSVASVGLATFSTLDLLLRSAQDATATPAERPKAASEAAHYFLLKKIGPKKSQRPEFPPDDYGFSVDPSLARELGIRN